MIIAVGNAGNLVFFIVNERVLAMFFLLDLNLPEIGYIPISVIENKKK